jgi:hypothetical protein
MRLRTQGRAAAATPTLKSNIRRASSAPSMRTICFSMPLTKARAIESSDHLSRRAAIAKGRK